MSVPVQGAIKICWKPYTDTTVLGWNLSQKETIQEFKFAVEKLAKKINALCREVIFQFFSWVYKYTSIYICVHFWHHRLSLIRLYRSFIKCYFNFIKCNFKFKSCKRSLSLKSLFVSLFVLLGWVILCTSMSPFRIQYTVHLCQNKICKDPASYLWNYFVEAEWN